MKRGRDFPPKYGGSHKGPVLIVVGRRSLLVNGKADLGLHTFSAVPLHRSTQARYNQFQRITGKEEEEEKI